MNDKDIEDALKRLEEEPKQYKIVICGGADYPELAEKLLEMRNSTSPGALHLGNFDEIDVSELEEVLERLSEEKFGIPVLELKQYEDFTPVDTYKPKEYKKTPSFRDKKYF